MFTLVALATPFLKENSDCLEKKTPRKTFSFCLFFILSDTRTCVYDISQPMLVSLNGVLAVVRFFFVVVFITKRSFKNYWKRSIPNNVSFTLRQIRINGNLTQGFIIESRFLIVMFVVVERRVLKPLKTPWKLSYLKQLKWF